MHAVDRANDWTMNASSAQTRTPNVAAPAPSAAPQQPSAQPAPSASGAPAASQDSFLSAEAREKALRELTDMGFERGQAELALRASFYHVERAADYLLSVSGETSRAVRFDMTSSRCRATFRRCTKDKLQAKEAVRDRRRPAPKAQPVADHQAKVTIDVPIEKQSRSQASQECI